MSDLNDLHRRLNRMKEGEASLGSFLVSASSFMAEAMAYQPLDWLVIDMEASHASKKELLHILQALDGHTPLPVVRVSGHGNHDIESALDLGARGILVPKVNTVEEAERAASACFYPPKGDRGVNCIRASGYYTKATDYLKNANRSILCIVQIESATAVENCAAIAKVPAVDILFVGPGDLAASYGQNGVVTGTRMEQARRRVVQACLDEGKIAGIFAHNVEAANLHISEGFRFIALGNELKFLSAGLNLCLKAVRRISMPV